MARIVVPKNRNGKVADGKRRENSEPRRDG
jgi:hypothetical protein